MDDGRGPGKFKCKFTPLDDARLSDAVRRCGTGSWAVVARQVPGRNARQCRERWANYVNPTLEQTPLSPSEELLLDKKFAELGPSWHVIASFFPTRSRNFIKNQWVARCKHLKAAARRRLCSNEKRSAELPPAEVPSEDQRGIDAVFPEDEEEDIIWEIGAADEF
jgi:hypothetical protein